MKLTRITISGADDEVEHQALMDLSKEFPFVEWGILRSTKRAGSSRYPSLKWLADACDLMIEEEISVHLCGELARRAMSGDEAWMPSPAWRLQLNGFSDYTLPMLLIAERRPSTQIILQCMDARSRTEARRLHKMHPNIAILDDLSGGSGTGEPTQFASHDQIHLHVYMPANAYGVPMGHAGGINETNIQSCIETVLKLGGASDEATWIDLETGARTDDHFDLDKVRRLLKLAAPFVSAP